MHAVVSPLARRTKQTAFWARMLSFVHVAWGLLTLPTIVQGIYHLWCGAAFSQARLELQKVAADPTSPTSLVGAVQRLGGIYRARTFFLVIMLGLGVVGGVGFYQYQVQSKEDRRERYLERERDRMMAQERNKRDPAPRRSGSGRCAPGDPLCQ